MQKQKKYTGGFGMVEVMVGVTIASLMTIAVVSVYISQSATFTRQSSRNYAASDAWDAYAAVNNLLKHARFSSFNVSYGAGAFNDGVPPPVELLDTGTGAVAPDEITVTFQTPLGMDVWPNNVAPFAKNQMRLTWRNSGADSYQIRLVISNGITADPAIILAGGNRGANSRVINVDLWPLDRAGVRRASAADSPLGGYQLALSTRAGVIASESDPVITVAGMVRPRN